MTSRIAVVGFKYRDYSPDVMNTGTITLEREPTNIYDPNAIKVLVNNTHVGYVSREDISKVKNMSNYETVGVYDTSAIIQSH